MNEKTMEKDWEITKDNRLFHMISNRIKDKNEIIYGIKRNSHYVNNVLVEEYCKERISRDSKIVGILIGELNKGLLDKDDIEEDKTISIQEDNKLFYMTSNKLSTIEGIQTTTYGIKRNSYYKNNVLIEECLYEDVSTDPEEVGEIIEILNSKTDIVYTEDEFIEIMESVLFS